MFDFNKNILSDKASIKDALIALNNLTSDYQTLFIIDEKQKLIGTLTDGDIRRGFINGKSATDSVRDVFLTDFQYIFENSKDVFKIRELRSKNIKLLPCLNNEGIIKRVYNLRRTESLLPLDAILMAGGKGERLRPLTENVPKPLIKIGNKSIIDYNVESLIRYGIDSINVTTNYLAEQIETHFSKQVDGVRINCIREPKYLGTIGSAKFVENIQNDVILVMNSDLFTNINFEEFFIHFIENNADVSVAAFPYSVSIPYGILEMDSIFIKNIREKPTNDYYANAGIYLIKRTLLNLIPKDTYFDATDFLKLMIETGYRVTRFPIIGYWIDIGKPDDLRKAQEFVKHL